MYGAPLFEEYLSTRVLSYDTANPYRLLIVVKHADTEDVGTLGTNASNS